MERRINSFVIMFLILGLFVGHTAAAFQECYETCFLLCIIIPTNTLFTCSVKCLKDCILPNPPIGLLKDTQNFCKLGCATTLCTNLSTKKNPGGEKVKKCVDSCSDTCTKN